MSSTLRRPSSKRPGCKCRRCSTACRKSPSRGVSMVYSFNDAKASSTHRTQYFEMFANRAIYSDGWVAATTPPLAPWAVGKTIGVDDSKWELYDLTKDLTQSYDLA